jgi:two-component system, NarL family, sensor kinase
VALLSGNVGGPWTVVAAIVAAFSLTPARQLVQRLVNRFLYGQRDEPYAVLSQVASRLETAVSAQKLLPDLLLAVTEALRLPFAAIELAGPDGSCRRILQGTPGGEVDRFPLVHQGDQLGALIVGRRPGQGALNPGERQLLRDLAREAAVAASNVALTEALLRSRERIVNAAEEERRRLRRDLHDGLGPVLTAAASKVDASRNLLQRDVARVDDLLCDVRSDLTGALEELRRLVYALRPPALDQLGLLGALREQASRSAVPVVVNAPDALPPLPAAVEVAAFRIITEAITNVARHSAASSCSVSIACSERLTLEVLDDGLETRAWSAGVGLSSMRERVAELGGRCAAGPRAAGGGRVWAELPLSMTGGGS